MKSWGCQLLMHIVVVGLNYKTAPVEIRERLTFDSSALGEAMSQLQKKKAFWKISSFLLVIVQKFMLLSTNCILVVII